MTGKAQASGQARVGVDLGGTQDRGRGAGSGRHALAEHRMPAPRARLCGDPCGPSARWCARSRKKAGGAGQHRHRHSGLRRARQRAGAERQLDVAQRPPVRSATSRRIWAGPIRLANDANCFALSEAVDGAGAGARAVFGVILGTGCGGGLVLDGAIIDGPRGIGGEWGHNPLPWANAGRVSRPYVLVRPRQAAWRRGYRAPASRPIMRALTGERIPAEEIAAAR